MIKSTYRGNTIIYNEKKKIWEFEDKLDSDTFTSDISKYRTVKCPNCQNYIERGAPDHCIGHLPEVVSACCGHGKKRGYIVFKNGKKISFTDVRVEKE